MGFVYATRLRIDEQYTDKCSHADAQTQLRRRAHPDFVLIRFHKARLRSFQTLIGTLTSLINSSVLYKSGYLLDKRHGLRQIC
jgi:hypothetical protein